MTWSDIVWLLGQSAIKLKIPISLILVTNILRDDENKCQQKID